jgi:DNA-binding Xre family transcriptional regulator
VNTPAPAFAHGDVVSRLADVLRLARYRWKLDITPFDVASATGLNHKTIRQMAREDPGKQPNEYYFRTLLLLCWYFGTEGTGDLLAWIPPQGKAHGQPPEPVIRRDAPPTELPPQSLTLHNMIPALLQGRPRPEVTRATGLRITTISNLLDASHPHNRIHRRTLAALCDYLSAEGALVSPGDLLKCGEGAEISPGP